MNSTFGFAAAAAVSPRTSQVSGTKKKKKKEGRKKEKSVYRKIYYTTGEGDKRVGGSYAPLSSFDG